MSNWKKVYKGFTILIVFGLGFSAAGVASAQSEERDDGGAPLVLAAENGISDSYIVVLKSKPRSALAAADHTESAGLLSAVGAEVLDSYEHALNGFLVEATESEIAAIRQDPRVAYVAQNSVVSLDEPEVAEVDERYWGIDRVNQRNGPIDGNVEFEDKGSGVDIYVVDTGVFAGHSDFGDRVLGGFYSVDPEAPDAWSDCHGHGTHVAGSAAGSTWGVASEANIYAVKVLEGCTGSGTSAGYVAGLDWIMSVVDGPSVANMSLGYWGAEALPVADATANLVDSGVLAVVAAGNWAEDACTDAPARVPEALTVAASDIDDVSAYFTNFGPCVDLYAPGVDVYSADPFTEQGWSAKSGTSMASPHAAGAAAVYLGQNPSATPAEVHDALVDAATPGVLTDVSADTPNKLLYVGSDGVVNPNSLTVRASGTTGQESIVLELDGEAVARLEQTTEFQEFTFTDFDETPAEVRVIFDNDVYLPGEQDRNVRVDYIELNGVRIESESPTVQSSGSWDGSCDVGYKQSEVLHCNGWFRYTVAKSDRVEVSVVARGTTGTELVDVEINGEVAATILLATEFYEYSFESVGAVDSFRVLFNNNGFYEGVDMNIHVDYIVIDGWVIQTESPEVTSLGSWKEGSCGEGQKQTETLHCDGWFDFPTALG